jgi:hypothetical protein
MALSAQVPEEDFEGMEVAVSRVAIKNTGDAISDAMDVEGLHVTLGDRVYFVLGADCVSVGFKPVKGEEDKLKRVMEFRANEGCLIDEPLIREALDRSRWVVQQRRDAAQGIHRLPGMGGNGAEGSGL